MTSYKNDEPTLTDQAMPETQKNCLKCTRSVLEPYPWNKKKKLKSLAMCVFV